MKIGKEFRWEMGHRLPEHDGNCRNLHGHSYRMVVEVEGDIDAATGMVMDFGDISKVVKPTVEELDHAFLCQESDTELLELIQRMEWKLVVLPVPSTVENICGIFVDRLLPIFSDLRNLEAFTVRIWETASSVAEIRTEIASV